MKSSFTSLPRCYVMCFVLLLTVGCASEGVAAAGGGAHHETTRQPSFSINIKSSAIVGPRFSITCNNDGRVAYSSDGRDGTAQLTEQQRRTLAEAAATFTDKPGPFFFGHATIRDGSQLTIQVTAGGEGRICFVHNAPLPAEVHLLVDTMKRIGAELDLKDEGRAALNGIFQRLDDGGLLADDEVIVVPNGSPEDLVRVVMSRPHPAWRQWHVVISLRALADLEGTQLGESIWEEIDRHPKYDAIARLQMIGASIYGGSTRGLEAFAQALQALQEDERERTLGRMIHNIISARALPEILERAEVKSLDGNATTVWDWMVRNRRVLVFDVEQRRYVIKPVR